MTNPKDVLEDMAWKKERPESGAEPKNRVSDLTDAVYRARRLVLSARQTAAETRETITAAVAQTAAALAALAQLEHDLEGVNGWLDIGEESE